MRRVPLFALLTLAGCAAAGTGSAGLRPAVDAPSVRGPDASKTSQTPLGPDTPLGREVWALRERVRVLLRAQAELSWRSWALGEAVDASALEVELAALATPESVATVDRLLKERAPSTGSSDEARALLALKLFLAGEYVAQKSAAASDAVAQIAAKATLSVDGQELPFRDLEALLASEAHGGRRRRIAKAALPILRTLNGPLAEREASLDVALKALGYPSYLSFVAQLRQVDLDAVASLAQEVLDKTLSPYRAAMEELARRELRIASLAQLRRADVARLFRTGHVDTFFPKEKLGAALVGSLAAMGLGPEQRPGLKLDFDPRPRKSPRALAIAFEVPKDVRLSLKPANGLSAWAQALHELGHAVGYALNGSDRFELQLLGGGAAGEAEGFLFEGLLDDRRFCAAQGVPDSKLASHARAAALRRLFALRQAAGCVLFEIAWRKEPAADPMAKYREVQAQAFGFPLEDEDAERYLLEHEDFFVCADQLRGQVAAGQLEAALESRVGPSWWKSEKAGAALAELLRDAGRLPLEELLQGGGISKLDPAPLVTSLEAALAQGRGP
jgi:hypothetical protein